MPTETTYRFALVEFRPNPARSEGNVPLGIVLEFVRPDAWVVGLAMLADLSPSFLDGLDPLSRALMDERIDIMRREVAAARNAARHPGDVLATLAEKNAWSFHVTSAREESHQPSASFDQFPLQSMAEQFVIEVHRKVLFDAPGTVVEQDMTVSPSYGTIGHAPVVLACIEPELAHRRHVDTPPAWMLPTAVWITPRSGSGH